MELDDPADTCVSFGDETSSSCRGVREKSGLTIILFT